MSFLAQSNCSNSFVLICALINDRIIRRNFAHINEKKMKMKMMALNDRSSFQIELPNQSFEEKTEVVTGMRTDEKMHEIYSFH